MHATSILVQLCNGSTKHEHTSIIRSCQRTCAYPVKISIYVTARLVTIVLTPFFIITYINAPAAALPVNMLQRYKRAERTKLFTPPPPPRSLLPPSTPSVLLTTLTPWAFTLHVVFSILSPWTTAVGALQYNCPTRPTARCNKWIGLTCQCVFPCAWLPASALSLSFVLRFCWSILLVLKDTLRIFLLVCFSFCALPRMLLTAYC